MAQLAEMHKGITSALDYPYGCAGNVETLQLQRFSGNRKIVHI